MSLRHMETGGGGLLLPSTSLGMTEVLSLTLLLALQAAKQPHGHCTIRFLYLKVSSEMLIPFFTQALCCLLQESWESWKCTGIYLRDGFCL